MQISISKAKEKDLQLSSFLNRVTEDSQKHARWLNTLSLLEHIGSRKILLTQSNDDTSEMILRHATEEARHALFFKKASRGISNEFSSGYHKNELLRGTSAKIYFAKLDATVRKNLKNERFTDDTFTYLAYLYTTTIIELRAMVVYENYNEVLESKEMEFNLRNLILEEQGHLDEMASEISKLDGRHQSRLSELISKEEILFKRFFNQLMLEVA